MLAGALIADAARSDTTPQHTDTTGDINRNLNQAPHLFKLTAADPTVYQGGTLRGANEDTFPVLRGQNGAVYFVHLDVGGMREPHWHPTAWEMNFVIAGRAKWTVLGTHPDGAYRNDVFDAGPGDLVFVPQGFFHYFENAGTADPLQVLIVFNTSADETYDDIGIVAAFNSLPRDVLATVFGVPVSAFADIPGEIKPVVITKRP
ncbi:cupin domain-containing protein [Nocardia sp. NPDC049220]|uniref:cupin domain-containing protein n=1 Tax=Nocardia sp. NPDC049220 TaxID=3155273 RepID=UPI0033FFC3B5